MLNATFWAATSSIATVALLGVTAAYVWATFRLLQATREQLWEASRPRLAVAVKTNQGGQFLVLKVENVGASPAGNLTFEFDRAVCQAFGPRRDLRDIPLFSNGLRMFPTKTPSSFGLGVAFTYLAEEADRARHPLSFTVTASYEHCGRAIRETFPIDVLDQYSGSTVERDHLAEFAKKFPEEFKRGIGDLAEAVESLKRPR